MTDLFIFCSVPYGHVPNYAKIFFDQEGHREVGARGSIEEHNATLFTTLVRNQVVNYGISHKKVDATGTKDQEETYQIFLRRHLYMMLEEWKLEHSCHI